MSEPVWTASQQQAIRAGEGDLLLAASAGSGKTAVLARRCLYLLTETPRPIQITELLALTFTDKAAGEMRQRIGRVLRERLQIDPGNRHLRRQLALLDQATICTFHSFCAGLLRDHYALLEIDPAFTILSAEESGLLQRRAMESLFEQRYHSPPTDTNPVGDQDTFRRLIVRYGTAGGDETLIHLLISLSSFLASMEHHASWRTEHLREMFDAGQADAAARHLIQRQKQALRRKTRESLAMLDYAERLQSHFPAADYIDDWQREQLRPTLAEIDRLLEADDFAAALERLQAWSWPRMKSRPKGIDEEEVAPVKALIGRCKDHFQIAQQYAVGPDVIVWQQERVRPYAALLIDLQRDFRPRYESAKKERGVLDFDDLERLAWTLLQNDSGEEKNAAAAPLDQIRRRYRHILVDEYQDISPLQEAILQALRGAGSDRHLMMVGDVKQSIYAFRQAEPEIFLRKLQDYGDSSDPARKRIDLQNNFRSAKPVIDAVNVIFRRCMTAPFAGMDYDPQAELVYGADFDHPEFTPAPVDIHLVDTRQATQDDSEDPGENEEVDIPPDVTQREAILAARLIKETVEENLLLDRDTGRARPAEYRDVVILLRSMKKQADIWLETLQRHGIPVYAATRSGFLQATEIQDVLSLLRLLDNPRQDIPLAAALRGPAVGLTEDQLARIRLHTPNEPWYRACMAYRHDGPDIELRERLEMFFGQLSSWRREACQRTPAELVQRLYADTGLPTYVLSLPLGPQRHGNLLRLEQLAAGFDPDQGLGGFLRFLEQLEDDNGDFAPAPVLSEADNVVRLMSMHQSKGLEFPVVLVGGLSRRFNKRDSRGAILWSRHEPGQFGLQIIDPDSRRTFDTVGHDLIAEETERRQLAEELRLLYVAMTRAQQKLIMLGTTDISRIPVRWHPWKYTPDGTVPAFALAGATSMFDWIGMSLAGHRLFESCFLAKLEDWPQSCHESPFALHLHSSNEQASWLKQASETEAVPDLAAADQETEKPEADLQSVIERLEWSYPQQQFCDIGGHVSVTELKHLLAMQNDPDVLEIASLIQESETCFQRKPTFRQTAPRLTATDVGTLTHLFLQRVAISETLTVAILQKQLDAMVKEGLFAVDQPHAIDLNHIARFFEHPLGRMVCQHQKHLQREWSFTLAVSAPEVYPDNQVGSNNNAESILVRGIIDCLLETEEGLVIIDYKTDRIEPDQTEKRAESYRVPMRLYRRAAETILSKPVRASQLFFLATGQAVRMDEG